ncbi:MAG: cobalamin B12-binding domain-containing protein [Rhodobacteraceae bacterium]|nr:cobalamin B12-binding domain-containing protein [Paracoccaceae bacterium]
MADNRRPLPAETDAVRHGEVESLATQVLSALAQRSGHSGQALDEAVLANFCANILRGGTAIRTDSVAELRRQGINVATVLDGYIPAAARELGDRWCRDELSFADVTIGVARLQAILRELGDPWIIDAMAAADVPNIMLIVPLEEFHTLGGMTAASQLRRMGLSVCLCLGQSEDEILQKVATRKFDMIAVSVSCGQRLSSARDLIERLRMALPRPVPIVVGGLAVEGTEDLCTVTGADYATSDPKEALRLCGLKAPAQNAPERTARG